jgi:hypothetical protein
VQRERRTTLGPFVGHRTFVFCLLVVVDLRGGLGIEEGVLLRVSRPALQRHLEQLPVAQSPTTDALLLVERLSQARLGEVRQPVLDRTVATLLELEPELPLREPQEHFSDHRVVDLPVVIGLEHPRNQGSVLGTQDREVVGDVVPNEWHPPGQDTPHPRDRLLPV